MNAEPPGGLSNAFPGLRPFREEEEYLFFGREKQVDALVDKLAATHFLAVVGTSGSGKSSLVNCGLVPALHRGLMAEAGSGWRVALLRPGNRPIKALAVALAQPGVLPQPAAEESGFTPAELIEDTLRLSKLGLIEAFEEAAADARPNLLVVVDQFEELFRYRALAGAAAQNAPAGEDATAFVNLLLEVCAHPDKAVYIVLTMRSDFLGECSQFFGLPEVINRGQYLVPRMTREERRSPIAGPLAVSGAQIDPVLLTRLVNDVGDDPDQLSILQHALNRTWARWREEGSRGPLAARHYEAAGTMAHALNQHAEEAYGELAGDRQRALCEALFKAITDKGTDARGTRRPTRLDTLCAITGASAAELTEVIDVFRNPARAFLMPPAEVPLTGETPIDISHESLMRVWDRLRGWVEDEAQSAQIYRRLAETADLHAAGRAGLIGSPELQAALDWRARRQPNAVWAHRYRAGFDAAMAFLEASAKAFDEAQRAEVERREEEARLRQREARTRLNVRWMALVALMLFLGLPALALLYYKAEERADLANSALQNEQKKNLDFLAEQSRLQDLDAKYRRVLDTQERQARVLAEVTREAAPQLRAKIDQTVDQTPLVYLQFADSRQAELAERLRAQLNKSGYSAPRIEKVSTVPAANELRYFRKDDESAAIELADRLRQWGLGKVTVKAVTGYESRTQLRQMEIWLARPDSGEIDRLVQGLNSESRDDRLTAGQALQSRYTSSPEAIGAVLDLFSTDQIGKLSAEGRINALYFLSRTSPAAWTPDLERRGREAVKRIEERATTGVAVGVQTRAELGRFVAVLDTVRRGGTPLSNPGARP